MTRRNLIMFVALAIILFLILRKVRAQTEKVTTRIAFEPFAPTDCGVARQLIEAGIPIAWCIDPVTGTEFRIELTEGKNLPLIFLTDPNMVARSLTLNFDNLGLATFPVPLQTDTPILQ